MVWNEPGKDKDPWNNANRPPDLERMVKNLQQRLGALFGGKHGGRQHFHAAALWWLLPVIVAAWLISGFYRVVPGNRGVNLVFGSYVNVTQPGLHWHLPWPIGRADIISGVQGRDYAHSYNRLLTSDGAIVVVDTLVYYHIEDVHAYLFSVATPAHMRMGADAGAKALLGGLTSAAVRAAVAHSVLADLLGSGRDAVEVRARQTLETALRPYHAGLAVTRLVFQRVSVPVTVAAAHADVQKARQDASEAQAAARTYADDLLPQAQAVAAAKLTQAEAYRTTLVGRAGADTARFDAILAAYRKAPGLTRDELYLQTMQDILGGANKVIVDARNGNVTVQFGQPFATPQTAPVPAAPNRKTTSMHPVTPVPAAASSKEGA